MIYKYEGQFSYSDDVVRNWNSNAIGVYYCGHITTTGGLKPNYIGKGCGDGGMRSRLLNHLVEEYWPDVTHFGYHKCDTEKEALDFEAEEIEKYKPKYNLQGK